MRSQPNFAVQKVDAEPIKYEIESEVYICFLYGKYLAAIDVVMLKNSSRVSLLLSAGSVAKRLEELRVENEGNLKGLVLWIHRESDEKMAKYVVELA